MNRALKTILLPLLALTAAKANTIQENYSTSVNFLTGAPVVTSIPGFNPALGTLNGIEFSYSSGAVLLSGNAISSNIKIDDPGGNLIDTILFPTMNGRAQQLESGNFAVPAAYLIDFERAGNVDLTFASFTACRGSANTPSGCNGFSAFVDGQATFNYSPNSPAAPVPEPASLLLFPCGVVVLLAIFVCRKKTDLPSRC